MTHKKDEVFSFRQDEWQVRLNGVVLPTTWNSKCAAWNGLQVERRRQAKRKVKP